MPPTASVPPQVSVIEGGATVGVGVGAVGVSLEHPLSRRQPNMKTTICFIV